MEQSAPPRGVPGRRARVASFTRAAEELHVSQPVVSRTVRDLERSLGCRPLRSGRPDRSRLTPEGAELFAIATDLLDRFDNALDRFAVVLPRRATAASRSPTLPSLAAGLLPSILVDFLAEHPDMRIEILDVTTTEAAQYVSVGQGRHRHRHAAVPRPRTLDVHVLAAGPVRRRDAADVPLPGRAKRSVTWKTLADGAVHRHERRQQRATADRRRHGPGRASTHRPSSRRATSPPPVASSPPDSA